MELDGSLRAHKESLQEESFKEESFKEGGPQQNLEEVLREEITAAMPMGYDSIEDDLEYEQNSECESLEHEYLESESPENENLEEDENLDCESLGRENSEDEHLEQEFHGSERGDGHGGENREGVAEPLVAEPPVQEASEGFLDINEYGNSEVSVGLEGVMWFNIYIGGIDSGDILEAIRESLLDPQFMWDIGEIMGGVRNGELELLKVSPVKASIVVNRLKSMPIQIRWEQHTIHQK